MRKIIYPDKPKRAKGFIGGGLTERKYSPVYLFIIKNARKQTSIEYWRGYLDAIRDIKKLNK